MTEPAVHRHELRVRVPATSANLGPGFDSLGLALGVHDEVAVRVTEQGLSVLVHGEGAGVPCDESHLVVRAMRVGLEALGVRPPGLRLRCRNRIPHGRGLGSSAAAIVAGLVAARGLLADGDERLDDAALLQLAAGIEGHPDNVAACLYGGLTVAWCEDDGQARALRLQPDPSVLPLVLVPGEPVATSTARGLLPSVVPHAAAAHAAGRAALLVAALTERPDLLLPATQDRLHQDARAGAMPQTARLVTALRERGVAAVVSGAGPSVLALVCSGQVGAVEAVAAGLAPGWLVCHPGLDLTGATIR
jgi:homoserine kinase